MPYITQNKRDLYNEIVKDLAKTINDETGEYAHKGRCGDLNYIITKLLKEVYKNDVCYLTYNEIIGCLECCKLEFYRHIIGPYEDIKIKSNGDVDPEL